MEQAQRFAYVEVDPSLRHASALPYVPITLELGQNVASVSALLDSGSTLNVHLTGNLAHSEARAILVSATIGRFAPVRLAFAWTRNDQVPVILGQINFFAEFDVCFFRSQSAFEIRPKAAS